MDADSGHDHVLIGAMAVYHTQHFEIQWILVWGWLSLISVPYFDHLFVN